MRPPLLQASPKTELDIAGRSFFGPSGRVERVRNVATTKDLRRYPRIPAPKRTLLAWQGAGKKLVSRVENLSLGGLYIRTPEPPPPGTSIQLLLDVPTGEVRARALVQRSKAKEGMAVKFIAMQHEDRGRLAQWLNTLATRVAPQTT